MLFARLDDNECIGFCLEKIMYLVISEIAEFNYF